MSTTVKFVTLAAALIAGNFIYQSVTGRHWNEAVERSFFQAVALIAARFFVT